MHWLNPGFRARFRKEPQSLVAVAPNHPYSVYVHYTRGKGEINRVQNGPADKQLETGDLGKRGYEEGPIAACDRMAGLRWRRNSY